MNLVRTVMPQAKDPASRSGSQSGKSPHQDGPVAIAMLLAALAGWVDATGFISSGGVFVSFMSGNTTHLAVSLAHHRWRDAETIIAIILLFVAGVAAGEATESRSGRYGPCVVLVMEAIFLAAGAVVEFLVPGVFGGFVKLALCPLAFAMGLQNATMHRPGGMSIGLTYITGTLVQVGRAIARRGSPSPETKLLTYVGVWLCLLIGAGLAAVTLAFSPVLALTAAASAAILLALTLAILRRQEALR